MRRRWRNDGRKDRNIESNLWKAFLKFLRVYVCDEETCVSRIIRVGGLLGYSEERFLFELQKAVPLDINYIRTCGMKKIFVGSSEFSQVFRIAYRHFFRTNIHLLNSSRKAKNLVIRKEHLKAARLLVRKVQKDY